MAKLDKRATIQEILDENHYSSWWISRPSKLDPSPSSEICILVNFKENRKAELAIPEAWLRDPRRHSAIAGLIALAIQNSQPISEPSEARQFYLLVPQTEQTGADKTNRKRY